MADKGDRQRRKRSRKMKLQKIKDMVDCPKFSKKCKPSRKITSGRRLKPPGKKKPEEEDKTAYSNVGRMQKIHKEADYKPLSKEKNERLDKKIEEMFKEKTPKWRRKKKDSQ